MYAKSITPVIRSWCSGNVIFFLTSTMAVVYSASKLFVGRIQGFSRIAASCAKYASTSTGKYASSVYFVINASQCEESTAHPHDTAYNYNCRMFVNRSNLCCSNIWNNSVKLFCCFNSNFYPMPLSTFLLPRVPCPWKNTSLVSIDHVQLSQC